MKYITKEGGFGPIEDCLDVALRVVLIMSPDPRKALELTLVVTISNPFFGGEGIIVRGIVLWFDVVITQKSLKRMFAPQEFSRREIHLVTVEGEICCMVNEK